MIRNDGRERSDERERNDILVIYLLTNDMSSKLVFLHQSTFCFIDVYYGQQFDDVGNNIKIEEFPKFLIFIYFSKYTCKAYHEIVLRYSNVRPYRTLVFDVLPM